MHWLLILLTSHTTTSMSNLKHLDEVLKSVQMEHHIGAKIAGMGCSLYTSLVYRRHYSGINYTPTMSLHPGGIIV